MIFSGFVSFGQGSKRSTYSDQTFLFSVAGDGGIPIINKGTFVYNLGGDIQAEYKTSPTLGFTANLAYASFKRRDIKINGVINYAGMVGFISGFGGIKYTLPSDIFFHGQLGLVNNRNGGGIKVGFQAGAGYDFSRNFDIEIGLRTLTGAADNGGTLSSLQLRVGYNF